MFHNLTEGFPTPFQGIKFEFSLLFATVLMYTYLYLDTQMNFDKIHFPTADTLSFSMTNLQVLKHSLLTNFSVLHTTVMLPGLHLPTAKSIFGNVKTQKKN